jgi:hypothetical protein
MNEYYIDAGGLPPTPPLVRRGGGGRPHGITNSLKTKGVYSSSCVRGTGSIYYPPTPPKKQNQPNYKRTTLQNRNNTKINSIKNNNKKTKTKNGKYFKK